MLLQYLVLFLGLSAVSCSELKVATRDGALNAYENRLVQMRCGKEPEPLKPRGSHFFVLNGKKVNQKQMNKEAPWVVSINYDSANAARNFNMSCTGTLISPRHVMTAAHCLVFQEKGTICNDQTLKHKPNWEHGEPSRFRIRAGTIFGNRHSKEGQLLDVKRIIYPQSFTNGDPPNSYCKSYNVKDTEDIAILELANEVQGALYPCLAYQTRKNVELTNYGYGQTLESQERLQLKKHTTKYVNCRQQWPNLDAIPNGIECSLYNGKQVTGACVGDSGGPVVAKYNGRTYSVGVLAGGTDCRDAKADPKNIEGDMMTSVPYYLNWICKWTGICPEGADPDMDERPTAILE